MEGLITLDFLNIKAAIKVSRYYFRFFFMVKFYFSIFKLIILAHIINFYIEF